MCLEAEGTWLDLWSVTWIYKAGTNCPFVKWNALRKLDVSGLLCPRSTDWCVWGGHLGRMESTVQMSWRPVLSVAPPSVQPSSVQATQHVCLLPLSLRPTVGLSLQILGSCSTLGCTPMWTRPAVSVFPFTSHQQPRDSSRWRAS